MNTDDKRAFVVRDDIKELTFPGVENQQLTCISAKDSINAFLFSM